MEAIRNSTVFRRASHLVAGLAVVVLIGGARQRQQTTEPFKTPNFSVYAPNTAMAREVAIAAENYRDRLAKEWLGHKLPRWSARCVVKVRVGQMGAGGYTTFKFARGMTGKMEVYGWDMTVQGPLDRILDSVLPHEVSHTILACHFRAPLPRWADEGAATLAEDLSEKRRQRKLVADVLKSGRRIPFRKLLPLTEYPASADDVMVLYSEGFSLADFLVQRGGKARYLNFLKDAMSNGWDAGIRRHYGYRTVESLEQRWSSWVTAGSPSLKLPKGQMIAAADSNKATDNSVVRSQTPERKTKPQPTVAGKSTKPRSWSTPTIAQLKGFGHSHPATGSTLRAPPPPRSHPVAKINEGWEVVADTGLVRDPFNTRRVTRSK
ncbi:MAG: hypothetical protein CMJ78_02785 [Planctomycetaceae bacterium]|nr:hypothetical protein [Planctomycetaceae bacterium]